MFTEKSLLRKLIKGKLYLYDEFNMLGFRYHIQTNKEKNMLRPLHFIYESIFRHTYDINLEGDEMFGAIVELHKNHGERTNKSIEFS